MAKVAREMVESAGINVGQLLELLVKNASAELTTYYYYTILRVNLIGLDGEGIKEIAEVARIEDRNHFEALVPRIYELGEKLPEKMNECHDISACPPASLPKDPRDVQAMLRVLVEAERCAVRGYTQICNMTAGKDHRTYDLSLAILNEEVEHESWFSEFLGEGPSGHFMRRGDTSPFVSNLRKSRRSLANLSSLSRLSLISSRQSCCPSVKEPYLPENSLERNPPAVITGFFMSCASIYRISFQSITNAVLSITEFSPSLVLELNTSGEALRLIGIYHSRILYGLHDLPYSFISDSLSDLIHYQTIVL